MASKLFELSAMHVEKKTLEKNYQLGLDHKLILPGFRSSLEGGSLKEYLLKASWSD